MKKTIISTTICLFLSITAIPLSAQWCSIGVKGGYSSILKQTQSYNEIFNSSNNLQNGGHIGIYMRLGRTWYIQPEALYNYYNYKSTINNTSTQYNIHTIDVPVLLGMHLVNTKMFKIRLMAGPKFNFNIGKLENMTTEAFSQELRNTRLALDCGIGFDIWRFTLDFRYNLMQDIFKIQNSENITLNKKPQHSIQSSIGFRLIGNNKKNKYKR
jgi:hypothetical protein